MNKYLAIVYDGFNRVIYFTSVEVIDSLTEEEARKRILKLHIPADIAMSMGHVELKLCTKECYGDF